MGCCKCILIDVECAKKLAGIDESVQIEQLNRPIRLAHDIPLSQVIGDTCYNELCEAKSAGTLTYIQTEMLTYIEPMLAEYIGFYYKQHLIKWLPAKANMPLEGATIDERKNALNGELELHQIAAETYKVKLKKFLDDNIAEFPCYEALCACTPTPDTLQKLTTW